jgi:hypothetical protein
MTTISSSTSIGITLTSPAYVNPIVINPGVTVANSGGNGIYASAGSWTIQNNGGISGTVDGIYLSGIKTAAAAHRSGASRPHGRRRDILPCVRHRTAGGTPGPSRLRI